MTAQVFGYARTSTNDQVAGLLAQELELTQAGCHRVFKEQVSSVSSSRPELENALSFVRDGDTLVITKLDRLARSMTDLLAITSRLSAKNVSLRILAMNLDTATSTGRLMMNLVGSIAEWEREIMLERQRDGIERAKIEGRYKGRVPTAMRQAAEIVRMKESGMKVPQIVAALSVSRASVFRVLAMKRDA